MAYQKFENSKQFLRDLGREAPRGIYLFLGEEEGEKDKAIETIIGKIFSDNDERINHTGRFHIENEEFISAYDFAMSGSMFSGKKVCVMRDIHRLRQSKDALDFFAEMIENAPAGTVIIMTSSENRPPVFINKNHSEKIRIVQFWRYFDRDMRAYILKKAGEFRISLDDDGIGRLLSRTGKDIKKVDDAMEMLKHTGSGRVSVGDIDAVVSDGRDYSVFEFIELLFRKDAGSFRAAAKLMDEGSAELQILHMVARQADMLDRFHSERMKDVPVDEAAKICGVSERDREIFLGQAKLFSYRKLKRVFQYIATADMEMKSSRPSKETVSNPIFNLISGILFRA